MTRFWRNWLVVAAGITVLAGLGLAALTVTGATSIHDAMFEFVFLSTELEASTGELASFAIGLTGAVMVGWATMMLVVLRTHRTLIPSSTWWALTTSVVAWFVVDGVVSISADATGNLVLNGAFVGLFAPALIATRPSRAGTDQGGRREI